MIGEGIFAAKDKLYNKNEIPVTPDDDFSLNISFPYMRYNVNPRVFIANKTKGTNKIQDRSEMKFENGSKTTTAKIRQLCVMATISTRTNLSYAINIENPKAVS